MEHLTFSAELMHKHRAIELQEIARVERFLREKKNRDAMDWQQRRLHRNRKNR